MEDELFSAFFDNLPLIAGLGGFFFCVFLGIQADFFSRKPVRRHEVMTWLSLLMGLWLVDGKHIGELLFWVGAGVFFFGVITSFFPNVLLDLKERWFDSSKES